MATPLLSYLIQRPETAAFLLPQELARTIAELFPNPALLPTPVRIFFEDETQAPALGFPIAESPFLDELAQRLERWIGEEIVWQVSKQPAARAKAAAAFGVYLSHLLKMAENALMSNLLNDYHAVFWLVHSADLAKQFSAIPRRVSSVDTQIGRTQGDALKYRIYMKWMTDTREQLAQVAARCAPVLDGEEERGMQYFRMLQEQTLFFTEEFISPDLRELKSYVTGCLRRDPSTLRDSFDRLRTIATEALQKDRSFRAALPLFGASAEQGITTALLLDPRFQTYALDLAAAQGIGRDDRELLQLLGRRTREFAVLHQLRRGLVMMSESADGQFVASDKRGAAIYSRSTRPLDFGRAGVVDPMVHRFGLIYDISSFSETLGNIARAGRKGEVSSYRSMLLFQRKLETIAERHQLQFEKFLGDGAFYTTRRALRLTRAALEIQQLYADMKRKGFAFDKGLRVALNFGYYRLLPLKTGAGANDRITEFYGPGIVELSRLTTGKANKEIDEIAGFLVAHGYDQAKVQQFFAPLARGVDVIDHAQHAREFYAYVNASGHLVNEGVVASLPFLQEVSTELTDETRPLCRIAAQSGTYIGFAYGESGIDWIGIRMIGMVSLKGLSDLEIGEIVAFSASAVQVKPIVSNETLVTLLRQEYHKRDDEAFFHPITDEVGNDVADDVADDMQTTGIVICARPLGTLIGDDEVVIGQWDRRSDAMHNAMRIPRGDFQRLFSLKGQLTAEALTTRKDSVRSLYHKLSDRVEVTTLPMASFRYGSDYDAFVLRDVVEKL
jgi:hypothetical protein